MTGEEKLLRTMINRALFAFERKTGVNADEWLGMPSEKRSVSLSDKPIALKAAVMGRDGYAAARLGEIRLLGDCLAIEGAEARGVCEPGMDELREANDLLGGLNFERRWQRGELTKKEIGSLDAFSKAKYAKNCKRKEQRK